MASNLRYIGLDVGESRTGVAVSAPGTSLATPLGAVKGRGASAIAEGVKSLLESAVRAGRIESGASYGGIVAGLPLNQEGGESGAAGRVREIVDAVAANLELPLYFMDERYTTKRMMAADRESGRSARKGRENIDARSAAEILESFLRSQMQENPDDAR